MTRAAFAAAAAMLLAATPGAPAADVTRAFVGETSQGRDVTVVAERGGPVRRLTFGWRAKCDGPGGSYRTRTSLSPPFDRATARRLRDAGGYRERGPDGVTGTIEVRGSARRTARGWRGVLEVTVAVRRGDQPVARCRTGRLTFRSAPPSP